MHVSVRGLSKGFGRTPVLREVSLEFPSRAFVTLLGPSGCGKTTLLRMLAGLEEVDAGTIRFGDRVMNGVPARARNIAMVFQSYALYPQMTVAQNMGYGLKVARVPKAEIAATVARVAAVLKIGHLLDRRPGQLSGGQRQRVALGRAMVRQPDVFLMDEPLSNLDAKLRVVMRSELRRFHRELGATTIYVTHDQLEAMTMSDFVAVMDGGRVRQFGTPEQVYAEPADLFVAGFVGNPPMNLVPGHLLPGRMAGCAGGTLPIALDRPGLAVTIGLRPQDLVLDRGAAEGGIGGTVTNLELTGSERLVEVMTDDGARLLSQIRADEPVHLMEPVTLRAGSTAVHVFDGASGLRLHEP